MNVAFNDSAVAPPRLRVRRARDRGHADHGWLDTWHTFSFAEYHDPAHVGFRSLRVLNDDRVAPGRGFPTHPHQDMEILTWVLEGSLSHRDSLGNGSTVVPGEIQRMSAGTGVQHSEANASAQAWLHLIQVWILPDTMSIEPSYEQKAFFPEALAGRLCRLASPDGAQGSVRIRQDAHVFAARLKAGDRVVHRIAPGRHVWLHVAGGKVRCERLDLAEGDGAATDDAGDLAVAGASDDGEVLLFDLA